MISQIKRLNIISIEEAMKINKMSVDQMYEGIKNGKIKAYKKNGSIYVINQGIDMITRGAEILDLVI
ncbi:helix-turn-helix domain-containing protein [Candidatus Bathyarchaeota archaeon]|nr:helix-turn-helix domain-containing protein [Candidatus Bathyarchaeota archaeon]